MFHVTLVDTRHPRTSAPLLQFAADPQPPDLPILQPHREGGVAPMGRPTAEGQGHDGGLGRPQVGLPSRGSIGCSAGGSRGGGNRHQITRADVVA